VEGPAYLCCGVSPSVAHDPSPMRLPRSSRPLRQEPLGPPKFLPLLSTHTTLFVDPGRSSGISPIRSLCVGFWGVNTIAICVIAGHGAVSRVGECGLPCGRRGSLCPLHLCRSASTSFTGATLGRSGWCGLTPQGLAPCQKRQALLGALTARHQPRVASCASADAVVRAQDAPHNASAGPHR